ncbi:MAG: hypothetical protein IRY98_10295 [Alicyclobacillaceae bacterium]|nr:hypothetical protein [Alicyclobacillaceae bacterium]
MPAVLIYVPAGRINRYAYDGALRQVEALKQAMGPETEVLGMIGVDPWEKLESERDREVAARYMERAGPRGRATRTTRGGGGQGMTAEPVRVAEENQPVVIDYVPSVVLTLEQMAENLRQLDEIRRRILRPGVDYDTVPGTDKPVLLKPGAERLLQFFGLGHRVQCVDQREDWDNGFFYYRFRVSIVKQYPGYTITVAECEGSANSKEKRYRNQDVFSIVNTLQKMAIKRALVGATLQATGTSGFFTQDVEDMDVPPSAETKAENRPANRPASKPGNGTNTTGKAMVINAMKEMRWTWDQLAEYATDVLGRSIKHVLGDVRDFEWEKILTALKNGRGPSAPEPTTEKTVADYIDEAFGDTEGSLPDDDDLPF